ncbi:Uncharacterized protein BP5553_09305 [Venustampulla echinocandica]|uniref:3CxxC-type domain-containing protein n=1 Tax=Venustampulla echinocandica TaxID=2656787 RepID=A0A370TCC7_9HELO|nr:Uncharacterized protein BP5553_09305 [Venustampulla echinocandica]RDL31903.1 Uncharacterized protein BP5553_09305 [Venustampulla echinocandica]
MTRPKPQRKPQQPKWSMFPLMHDNVAFLLEVEDLHFTFHDLDEDIGSIQTYDTSIMGRFNCRNKRCESNGWSSMRIAITIRMYPGEQYNARVYHQRCIACNLLSKPILDDSYAERVAYRLKKWCGVELELPEFSGQSKGPHAKEFCEGCKAGHCSEGRRIDGLVAALSNFSLGGI